MNFWPIFILFHFLFFIFFLIFFFIFEKIEKVIPDSAGSCLYLFKNINKFELAQQMAGRGGRLAPPASKCHKKKFSQGGSFILLQFV